MKSLTERHVQAIWYDESLRPKRLVTRRGSEVNVVFPGEWNQDAGPDFRNAVLEIGRSRRRIVGDVEVHLCPSDWDFHGHGADSSYRNVIAHVTWGCGPAPSSLPPGTVSIWLGRFLAGDPAFDPAQIDLAAYPFARLPIPSRPCEQLLAGNRELAGRVLAEAGRHRLRMKARRLLGRLNERISESGGESRAVRRQLFYEEVMTALGYSRNSPQFRRVAERVPIRELPDDAEKARTALLTAGTFEEWNRSSLRPYNTPELRLSRAADVFISTPLLSYSDASDFSMSSCRGMIAAMHAGGFLGRGRAAAILSNVITPFAIAEGRIAEAPGWLPAEDISEPVRLTAWRLFGRDHNPAVWYASNGLYIQGLLEIRRIWCSRLHPECRGCGVAGARNE